MRRYRQSRRMSADRPMLGRRACEEARPARGSATRTLTARACGTLAPSRQAAWRQPHGPGVRLLGQLEHLPRGPTPRGGTRGHARRQIPDSHPLREPVASAEAGRPLAKAVAAGSVPPEMRQLWNRMESRGVQVRLFDRVERDRGEQEVPDRWLQLCMLEDALDHNGDPGIVALLTGDGAGYAEGQGFPPHAGADAQARMAGGGAFVGAFVQPGDAPMGGGERRVRVPGRPLRGDHLPRAVPPGSSACAGAGSCAAGSVAPPHGVTRSGPATAPFPRQDGQLAFRHGCIMARASGATNADSDGKGAVVHSTTR